MSHSSRRAFPTKHRDLTVGQDSDWKEEKKNHAHALGSKKEFDITHDFIEPHHQHYLHPQLSFGIGGGLITLGFLENHMFFVMWIWGMIHVLKKYIKIGNGQDNKYLSFVSSHPKYFFLGGALAYPLFVSHGYEVGEIQGLTIALVKLVGL